MTLIAVLGYVLACLLTGLFGRHRRMGFFGTFMVSLVITPLLMLLLLALTGPAYSVIWRRTKRPRRGAVEAAKVSPSRATPDSTRPAPSTGRPPIRRAD